MSLYSTENSVLQELQCEQFSRKNVRVFVKRDDLIDPEVSGNKWRKLLYNIEVARYQKKEGIMTFGGAFSNHLLATASACKRAGLKAIGVVRGEELTVESNQNLKRCHELGMQLVFISRVDYQLRNEKIIQEEWKEEYPTYLFVPEGGANYHGMVGCQEIWKEIPMEVHHMFVAQGTATTSCGLLTALPESTTLHVVPVIKGFNVEQTMRSLLFPFLVDEDYLDELLERIVVHSDHHFGGYAKVTEELRCFQQRMKADMNLPLDLIYTAKAFAAMIDWIDRQEDLNGKQVVFLHTGGLKNGSELN